MNESVLKLVFCFFHWIDKYIRPMRLSVILPIILVTKICSSEDMEQNARLPTFCEVCKHFAFELEDRLQETGKTAEVLRSGHGLEGGKRQKAIPYKKSELRLIESIHEPHICDRFLSYDVHKEKQGSARYSRGRSETMQTLHDLVKRGTKVDIGIPYELWDKPSVEITHLQKQCYRLVEEFEDDLEEWYLNHYDERPEQQLRQDSLLEWFCRHKVLERKDAGCLDEIADSAPIKEDL